MRNSKRRIGAALLTAGALAIGGGFLLEGPASAQNNPQTECGSLPFVAKFNGSGVLVEGGNVTLRETTSPAGSQPRTFSWTSTVTITKIVLKAGGNSHNMPVTGPNGGTFSFNDSGQGNGISHITFCGAGSASSSSESSSSSSSSSTSSSSTSSSSTSSSSTSSSSTSSSTSETSSVELTTQAQTSEVLGVSVTNTPAAPAPAVAGVQQTQAPAVTALPRTGLDPGLLLMLGGTLVVSGILVLRYSTVIV